ncbi:MAG: squalene synthase HpnC [Candidatus Muproteobacteria bacterium RBG_16_65_34]|uniref:Squalene synthase HpnC n=1 Tax=Candidatus Muproteobacteria bacterium RBG_16_65_34 TaxID=1817760 RepID=A0A1F6TT32_9PROT|nr:MAG: squalene synthase HpnC [Candidatus Muproteobacteria bacterium RBG_16_65_34]
MSAEIEAAHRQCREIARRHYENFPVASLWLPRTLRRPVAAIYAFARAADDIADEGNRADEERLELLDEYARRLDALDRGEAPAEPQFLALADTIRRRQLPLSLFHDLLNAFRQDVVKKRYADFGEVRAYCRLSANPIGRLLLILFRADTGPNRAASDAICTALQLINFLQDIESDYARGRIYLPQDEMRRAGVDESHIRARRCDPAWRALIDRQIARARELLRAGAPLGRALSGRIGFEMRLILAGGNRVLDKLQQQNARGFLGGARLGPGDWVRIFAKALSRES